MKTDTQLQVDVVEELNWNPSTRAAEIGVAVKGGVVTLTGFVTSYAQKCAAERAVERICGVQAVAEELQVRLPNSSLRTDTDIAHSAVQALRWNVQVPDDRIKIKVENCTVTLVGDVDFQYQKESAEEVVRDLVGVKGVRNLLLLKPGGATAGEVRERIAAALKRNATLDADRIAVEARDGKVVLRGTVRSWAERQDAERAAWSAPGVQSVEDHLAVGL